MPASRQLEVWLPVGGYEGLYEVSNLGRVRNDRTGKVLKPGLNRGYAHVALYRENDGGKTHYVHAVVLRAFCGPPPFIGAEVCHNNGSRADNQLSNLRWGSKSDNAADRARHGSQRFGTGARTAKLNETQVRDLRRAYRSGRSTYALAKDYGLSTNTIWCAVTGATWKHVEGAVCNGG